jgi:hypothetical protein
VSNPLDIPIFENKNIECVDCNTTFVFTEGEQSYFWAKGMAEPKRCPECRKKRREKLEITAHMSRISEERAKGW